MTPDSRTCGCCGRTLPANRLAELGSTPGVHLCAPCGLWIARRASRVPDLGRLRHALGRLAHHVAHLAHLPHRGHEHGGVHSTIPILTSTDLDRTTEYWGSLGFEVAERHDGYLVTHAQGVELHFGRDQGHEVPAAFIHVDDAGALHRRLQAEGVDGIGPAQDMPWGLREFVVTDPDGNRVRVGSPIHEG